MTTATNDLRITSAHLRLGLWIALLSLAACADGASRDQSIRAAEAEFPGKLALIRAVNLQQPESAPLVRASGFDIDSIGNLVVGDLSEGNIKVFRADGTLRMVLGRKGEGPGEFQRPTLPRTQRGESILVVDNRLRNLSRFKPTGEFHGSVLLLGFSRITDFEALPDGTYLLAGTRTATDPHTVFRIDSLGRVLRRYLPISDIRPVGENASPTWESIRRTSIAVNGRYAYAVNTLADSIWTLDIESGETRSARLVVPGYVKPKPPKVRRLDLRTAREWVETFHIANNVEANDAHLLVSFVKGDLDRSPQSILVMKDNTGQWIALKNAPIRFRAMGDSIVFVSSSATDLSVRAVTYR